ncbi:TerD family protein, partial [Pseudanabaenaceae cyanobacterium LEGE 13415]|nr:TerD family protein [Pseudanabaenaceae cyanobacterium LEGE 13415]
MLTHIALRRLNIWQTCPGSHNAIQAQAIAVELAQLGYRMRNLDQFTAIDRTDFEQRLEILKHRRGNTVKYVPLFTNFPDDLPNDHEYLLKRILSFFGISGFDESRFGADPTFQMQRQDLWQTAIDLQAKRMSDAQIEWITLDLMSESETQNRLEQWALNLLYGATPIKEVLWEDLNTVIRALNLQVDYDRITIKETLARLATQHWQTWQSIIVKTPTDLLRMFAALQSQDVSLATKVDFKGLKLSKPQRREIIKFLNSCAALEADLLRYRGLWINLSRWLHPGDFCKGYPRVANAFDDLRNNRIKSFEAQVINAAPNDRLQLLSERPSLLLRKLSWLLKDTEPSAIIATLNHLQSRVDQIPLPLLLTTYCALNYDRDRVAINKNSTPHTLNKRIQQIEPEILHAVESLIICKLSGTKPWQRVWIDPQLDKLVIPLQARKQSDGLLNLARGSRLPLGDVTVLRLFVYWHESATCTDLDLSLLQLNSAFEYIGHVGWNHYGNDSDVAHSGDIQSAPLGAAEFIDIRLSSIQADYLMPSIVRYTGESFSQLNACYAGWMKRSTVSSDTKTFDAKTVAEKVEVYRNGRLWIPFLLDVEAQEMIYIDLYSSGRNTIESNPYLGHLAKGLAAYTQAKPTFGQLAR